MLNIPESVKALFKKDGVHKNLRIHFPNAEMPDITNENIVKESLHFTESICSQNTFRFGLAEASVLEFETVGIGNMYGMTIEAAIEIDASSLSAEDIAAIETDPGDGTLINNGAAGKNLCGESFVHGIYTINNGTFYSHEGASSRYVAIGIIPIVGGGTYTFSWANDPGNTANAASAAFYRNGSFLSGISLNSAKTFTAPENADGVAINLLSATAITSISQISTTNPQLERGSTATPYEPYRAAYGYSVPLGVFRVESCPRNHGAMAHRQVTAYTFKETDYENFPNLSNVSIFPQLIISSEAFLAKTLETISYHDELAFGDNMYLSGSLYDSAGNSIVVSVSIRKNGTSLQSDLAKWCRVYDVGTALNTDYWTPSFVEAVGVTYDYDKHYAFGQRMAKALTDAGLDLTYNSKKQKVFANNELALLANFPYYFYPCLYYKYTRLANDFDYTDVRTAPKVKTGELIPIVALRNSSVFTAAKNFPSAFKADETDMFIRAAYVVACANLTGEDDFEFQPIVSTIAANIPAFTMEADFPTATPTIKRYGLTSYGTMLPISPATTGENIELVNLAGNITHQTYNYLGTFSYLKMIDGILELSARFMKNKRAGGFELVRLSKSSPLSILPDNYSECWWDEYDISPIGSVTVSYLDANNNEATTVVQISGGGSSYDMSGNELLKRLANTTLESVSASVISSFAPWVGVVDFTPTELTMQCFPWLEAGDALEITAEDGTVVNTYALRVEMEGIQHMTARITADGGEIIGEV